MGKRNEFPQLIAVDICECGSDRLTCLDSRAIDGVRKRKKKCLDCGRIIRTREISEEEWQDKIKFERRVEKFISEVDTWKKKIYGVNG